VQRTRGRPAAQTDSDPIDSSRARHLDRLTALEEALDAGTVRHLEALGVGAGWHCLEVGAGAGSIARWLCERVGRGGHVLATDLDVRFVEAALLHQSNGTVLQHDLLRDRLPEASFDLVHARLLLAWLAEPGRGLARLVAALKPGGWLLAEEMDCISIVASGGREASSAVPVSDVLKALHTLLDGQRAFDAAFGRRLHAELESAGLTRVRVEGRVGIWRAGSGAGHLWRLTLEQLREPVATSGPEGSDEIDRVIASCDDPRMQLMSPVTMAAWGRRPLEAASR
jgi:SAM-dependent methyltransferase